MKLSELLGNYKPDLRAELKVRVELDNGEVLEKGCISDLVIDKGDGTYHFEVDNDACTVTREEIHIFKKVYD